MSTAAAKHGTLFLNGVEVEPIEPTGNVTRDLAAARRFLAEQGISRPQKRLTPRANTARSWRKRFF